MSEVTTQSKNTVATMPDIEAVQAALMEGDLSKLTSEQKVAYYNQVCTTMGLNSLTKPFEYMKINGKEVLYPTKGTTDQLRRLYGIDIKIVDKSEIGGIYIVTVEATDRGGRKDTATGAVSIANLQGENLANAIMKAETKAKRRATLSICGLGMLDESEVESIPKSQRQQPKKLSLKDEFTAAASGYGIDNALMQGFVKYLGFSKNKAENEKVMESLLDDKDGFEAQAKAFLDDALLRQSDE